MAALISGLHHTSEFGVDGGKTVDSPEQQPVFFPETREYGHHGEQHRFSIASSHDLAHAHHAGVHGHTIEERLQQARPGTEEVVYRLPGDAACPGERLHGQLPDSARFQVRPRGVENSFAGAVRRCLPLAKVVGPLARLSGLAWIHDSILSLI